MSISLEQISREVGVSRGAIGHVLNGREKRVGAKTCQRIKAALKRHDYHTNGLVRALRAQRTQILGVLVPSVEVSLYPQIITAIESAAAARKYQILITQHHSMVSNLEAQVVMLRQRRMDGLLIFPVNSQEQTELYRRLLEHGVPFVACLQAVQELTLPLVVNDDVEIGRVATRHLLELGHRRIACLRGYPKAVDAAERVEGYRQALRAAGVAVDEGLIAGEGYEMPFGDQAIEQLLSRGERFTAVVACNDKVAIGAAQALERHGLRVPQDVSLVGCGNLDVGQFFRPAISSVDQKPQEMGNACVEMLLERIENPKAPLREQRIWPELIVRKSTAALVR